MNTPIQWAWDPTTIQSVIATIEEALQEPNKIINYKELLKKERDRIHEECQELERNGMAEDCGPAYLAIFDGLSLLSLAVSGRAVNVRFLGMALEKLRGFFDCEVAS